MRIAVMGAGALGGYFGGVLARAGNPVVLIARGSHLHAIQERGLEVRSHWDNFTVPIEATDDAHAVGPVDLVLHTVKTYQNEAAISALRPLMGPHTCILPLQNGVDSYQSVAEAMGAERVLPGLAYIEAHLESPGVVVQRGGVVRLVFGKMSGHPTPRCEPILQTFLDAGIDARVSGNMARELWTKFLFISVLAGVTSAARARLSALMPHPQLRDMVISAMKEVEAVARARGVDLDQDVVPKTMGFLEGWANDLKASMHTDLELGRPLELDALTGSVVRLGREAGVPTPINDILYTLLMVHKDGAPEPQ